MDYLRSEVLKETGLRVSCYDIHHQMAPQMWNGTALQRKSAELEVAELLGAEHVQIVGETFAPDVAAAETESLILSLSRLFCPPSRART